MSPIFRVALTLQLTSLFCLTPVWAAEETKTPEEKLPDNPVTDSVEMSVVKPPDGTLGPVTLKVSLQKTETLPLTLEEVLNLASGQNITVRLGDQAVEQQRLDYQYRLSELLPDITARYRQSRFVGAVQIFGGQNFSLSRTTYQPELNANYTIYTGGQNIFEIRSSRKRLEAQRNMQEETRQDVLKQVALAYYNLQLGYWQKGIALQSIQEAEEQVKVTQARYDNGLGIKLDVLQAETILSQRKQDLLLAENAISRASQSLLNLLNMDLSIDIVPASLESTMRQMLPQQKPFTEVAKEAKINHPKIKALRRLREASQIDIRAAKASVFPKIDVTAYINGTGPELSAMGFSRFAGVEVSTNLLDNMGVGSVTRVKQARAIMNEADLTLLQAERVLEENLANNWVDLETWSAQIKLARETLTHAKLAYQQALGRLKAGVGTNVDLENAMTRLTDARTRLANAFLEYNKTQVSLLSNMGALSISALTQGNTGHGSIPIKP